jgi:hypothetical protein
MSHKDAPPPSPEQERMEAFYKRLLSAQGTTCGFGRDKHGNYLSIYARDAWAAWQAARSHGLDQPVVSADRWPYIVPAAKLRDSEVFFIDFVGQAKPMRVEEWVKRGYSGDDAGALYERGVQVANDLNQHRARKQPTKE